jgi:hypothetical protein
MRATEMLAAGDWICSDIWPRIENQSALDGKRANDPCLLAQVPEVESSGPNFGEHRNGRRSTVYNQWVHAQT